MSATTIDRLLQAHGFELCRSKKHKVYRSKDGKTFVRSNTPSDVRAEQNTLSDLCHLLGIKKAEALESLRRQRKVSAEHEKRYPQSADYALAMSKSAVAHSLNQPAAVTPVMTREDRRLAKRLERIERNEKAKQEKFESKWREFLKRDALWFVHTNEFVFISEYDDRAIRLMEDVVDDLERESVDEQDGPTAAEASMAKGTLAEMPWMVVHFIRDGEKVIFIFDDGSAVCGGLADPPPRVRGR